MHHSKHLQRSGHMTSLANSDTIVTAAPQMSSHHRQVSIMTSPIEYSDDFFADDVDLLSNDKETASLQYSEEDILGDEVENSSPDSEASNVFDGTEDVPLAQQNSQNDPELQNLLKELRTVVRMENEEHPWSFQNDPQWAPNEQRPQATPDIEGRLNKMNWCSCTNCVPMPTVEESRCCREIKELSCMDDVQNCVIEHNEFLNYVIREDFLLRVLRITTDLSKKEIEEKNNRYCRLMAYRSYIRLIYGVLGSGNRIPIPSCVVNKIRTTFPDPCGLYTGFKWYTITNLLQIQHEPNF